MWLTLGESDENAKSSSFLTTLISTLPSPLPSMPKSSVDGRRDDPEIRISLTSLAWSSARSRRLWATWKKVCWPGTVALDTLKEVRHSRPGNVANIKIAKFDALALYDTTRLGSHKKTKNSRLLFSCSTFGLGQSTTQISTATVLMLVHRGQTLGYS